MKVYGNGSYEARGKDKYRFTIVVGYKKTEGGKPKPIKKRKTVEAHGDREARRMLNRWIDEVESQTAAAAEEPASMTLSEYLDRHIRDCEIKGLSEKTVEGYAQIANQRVKPALGDIPLSELTPHMLTDFYREQRLHGNAAGGALSVGTVKKTAAFINCALGRAVSDGYLANNPNERAEKFTGKRGATKRKAAALNIDDMNSIIAHAKHHPNRGLATAIMIAAFTGMRRAEICGLRWKDIDMCNSLISVEHDLIAVKKKGAKGKTLKLSPTKTPESERIVPMAKPLRAHLEQELERQKTEMERYGIALGGNTPVVRGKYGSWIYPDTITTNFKSFARELDMDPDVSFKSLRSGVASVLAEAGAPVTQVAALLGHTDISTSIRHYIRYVSNASSSAVSALESAYLK